MKPSTEYAARTLSDEHFMQLAIEESTKGDWPYGAVITRGAEIIAQGHNTTTRDSDPTAHAEVNVIRAASKVVLESTLKGCTLYTSSESCPMCASAEIWASVSRVVYGASIQQLIAAGQAQIDISAAAVNQAGFVHYELTGGVLAEQAVQVVKDFSAVSGAPSSSG